MREQRQRRKTWLEIAGLLFNEKGIRVASHRVKVEFPCRP
jgi:hypothetical protein